MSAPSSSPIANAAYRHFRVVHRLRHRLRLLMPGLVGDAERCYILEILLRKYPGLTGLKSVPEIGSLTLFFEPQRLPEVRLLVSVEAIIGKLLAAPPRQWHTAQTGAGNATGDGDAPLQECLVAVAGMTCASCALFIELVLARDPAVTTAQVNFASGTAQITSRLSRETLFARIRQLGYEPQAVDTARQRKLVVAREQARLQLAKRHMLQAALLTVPVMISGMRMHHQLPLRLAEFALTSIVLFGIGGDIFRKAWALARQRQANMDTLIALGSGAAWLYSLPGLLLPQQHVYFESAAGIVSFVLLGRYLEEQAKGKASEAVRKLIDLQAPVAHRFHPDGQDGVLEDVPVEQLRVGDRLLVRPGEIIPCDGEILAGHSGVDESLLTGESRPLSKQAGDKVVGGCLNGNGSLTLCVTATGSDTVLAGIIRLVDQAQGSKLPIQKLADRISARFVPAVSAVALITLAGWLLRGSPFPDALSHAIAVLLIACPCALGLATPTAIMVGTGQAAQQGIYIRNGEALETAAHLDTLVFDKTGTLTQGQPGVTEVSFAPGLSIEKQAHLLGLLVGAEARSEHFLARAIVNWCQQHDVHALPLADFSNHPGQGLCARSQEGHTLHAGNAALLDAAGISRASFDEAAMTSARQGLTPVFVALDGECLMWLAIADPVRPEARAALAALHQSGMETVMLTGDVDAVAQQVARQLGMTRVVAQVSPADKIAHIRQLQAAGHKVGMVGDGINDAPALAAADVGFAIGSGADVALEAADMTLLGGDLFRVVHGIALSRRTLRIIRQNLFWALGYNMIAIPFAAAGRMTPMLASAAMGLSSVSVVSNSLRLKKRIST